MPETALCDFLSLNFRRKRRKEEKKARKKKDKKRKKTDTEKILEQELKLAAQVRAAND
jgi:thiamine pyrophosphokinase